MEDEIEDPAAEQITKSARTLLMAAGVAAEQIARARQTAAERRAAAEGAEANQLQARWDAERSLAIVEVTSADRDWFDRATPQQIGAVWQTAQEWAQVDPEFGPQAERIRVEIEERYGLDIASVDATGSDLSDELHAQEQFDRAKSRDRERHNRTDAQAADEILLTAGRDYDSDRRRQMMGERARAAGVDQDVVDGRVLAANAHARPLSEATQISDRPKAERRPRHSPRSRSRDSEIGR
jgi:hypothetical protein